MDEIQRDVILGRLDERTKLILDMTNRQEEHLVKLNDKVSSNKTEITRHGERLKALEAGVPIKLTKKQVGAILSSLVTVIGTMIVAVGKMFNLW